MKWLIVKRGILILGVFALLWIGGDWGYARLVARHMARAEPHMERDADGLHKGCEAFTVGQGDPAILMVHGFADSPAVFRPMSVVLAADGFTCRAMRLPGAAMPITVSQTVTRQMWEAEILREVRALHKTHSEVWLIGHSMGGALCAKIAAQHPEEIRGLILLAPLFEVSSRRSIGFSPRASFEFARCALVFTDTLELFFTRDIRDPSMRDFDQRDHFIPFSIYQQLFALTDDVRGLASRIRQPVLVVVSTTDRVVSPAAVRRFFTDCASSDKSLVESEKAGHVLQLDRGWQELTRTISTFIEKRTTRKP